MAAPAATWTDLEGRLDGAFHMIVDVISDPSHADPHRRVPRVLRTEWAQELFQGTTGRPPLGCHTVA